MPLKTDSLTANNSRLLFLPSTHQGVPFRGSGDPILHVSNPPGLDARGQRDSIDVIQNLNRQRLGR